MDPVVKLRVNMASIRRRVLMDTSSAGELGTVTQLRMCTLTPAARRFHNAELCSTAPTWHFQYIPHREVDVQRINI